MFDPSMEIIGMQSNEDEYVPFIRKVNPASANVSLIMYGYILSNIHVNLGFG